MNAASAQNQIKINSDFDKVQPIEDEILSACERFGFDEQAVFAIKLALEEAITNAIKHGNGLDPDKHVFVHYKVDQTELWVSVRDEGVGFSPDQVPDPTRNENLEKPSGRGVMLMKAYMSHVEFDNTGNTVMMTKKRDCSQPNHSKRLSD